MISMSLNASLAGGGRLVARSEIGWRRYNADHVAFAEYGRTGAVVICDGVDDDAESADCARIAAHVAAVTAANTRAARTGVGAARAAVGDYYQGAPPGQDTTATILVAVLTDNSINLAWAGDSVAFALTHDGVLHALTEPHHPLWPKPCNVTAGPIHQRHIWLEHPGGDGAADVVDTRRLLLCSDGLTERLSCEQIATALRITNSGPTTACAELLKTAFNARTGDNVTIAVIDLPAGAFMHALTSVTQTIPGADAAFHTQSQAIEPLQLAAA
jgi:serine/threonine protein phosphatase PrpC